MTLDDWKRHANKCAKFVGKGNDDSYRGATGELLLDLQIRLLRETVARSTGDDRCEHLHERRSARGNQKLFDAMTGDRWPWLREHNVYLMREREETPIWNLENPWPDSNGNGAREILEGAQDYQMEMEFDGCLSCWDETRETHYLFDSFTGKLGMDRKGWQGKSLQEITVPESSTRLHTVTVMFQDIWMNEKLFSQKPHRDVVILPIRAVIDAVAECTLQMTSRWTKLRPPNREGKWRKHYAAFREMIDCQMRREWEAWRKREAERARVEVSQADVETVADFRGDEDTVLDIH